MLDLVDKLASNHKIGALSTIPKEWASFKEEKFDLPRRFDTIVTSGRTGIEKPNKRIYEEVIQRLKVQPKESIFIDDTKSNLKPAKKIGMTTIHFQSQQQLEKALEEKIVR